MSTKNATVFIIDDDSSVRAGLSRLLRSIGYKTEVYSSAEDYLEEKIDPMTPGCILMDLKMPGLSGLELQAKLNRYKYQLPIIFITGHGDISASVKAMKLGAIDFLTKPFEEKDLLSSIELALTMDRKSRKEASERAKIQKLVNNLTPREHEIMTHIISGSLNKVIAQNLSISEKTVKIHRGRVMEKMKLRHVADLVRSCDRVGIKPALKKVT